MRKQPEKHHLLRGQLRVVLGNVWGKKKQWKRGKEATAAAAVVVVVGRAENSVEKKMLSKRVGSSLDFEVRSDHKTAGIVVAVAWGFDIARDILEDLRRSEIRAEPKKAGRVGRQEPPFACCSRASIVLSSREISPRNLRC